MEKENRGIKKYEEGKGKETGKENEGEKVKEMGMEE